MKRPPFNFIISFYVWLNWSILSSLSTWIRPKIPEIFYSMKWKSNNQVLYCLLLLFFLLLLVHWIMLLWFGRLQIIFMYYWYICSKKINLILYLHFFQFLSIQFDFVTLCHLLCICLLLNTVIGCSLCILLYYWYERLNESMSDFIFILLLFHSCIIIIISVTHLR